MYVCICRAVTAQTIRKTLAEGARTVDDVERCTGAGGDCGSCREEIGDLIEEARLAKSAPARRPLIAALVGEPLVKAAG